MSEMSTVDWGRRLLTMNAERADRPREFALFGRQWDLLPGVFAPVYCFSTQLFASWVPYPVGGTLLEVGSGAGVMAVRAALAGCAAVTAVDISAAAVENTERNVRRHGVDDRVTVLRSDLFDALDDGQRFDVVFWNSNFIEPTDEVGAGEIGTDIADAIFDPDYQTHQRFLAQAPDRLAPGGRLLLGFSSLGNRERLDAMAADVGLAVDTLLSKALFGDVRYEILELTEA